MNRLEAAVRAVMTARNLANLSDVAARIGLQKSNLSKILLGQLGVSPTNLRKLVTGISEEPEHQFAILSAHLFDEAERSGFPLALLAVEMRGQEGAGVVSFADLPAQLQRQLRLIGDEVKDGDDGLGGTVAWLAGMIDEHRMRYPVTREGLALVAEGDTSRGPFSSPTDEVIREQERRGRAGRGAGSGGSATPGRNPPTRPHPARK